VRPAILKIVLVLSMTVLVIDRQAEPVSSAEQVADSSSWTEMVEADENQASSIEFVLPSR
jgi:hypothetical protein